MIAFSALVALKLLNLGCEIVHYCRRRYQKELSLKLGAHRVVQNLEELEEDFLSMPLTKKHRPLMGNPVYSGGYDLVYDCVGSKETLSLALRMTRERGHLILIGGAGEIAKLDWTQVWTKELSILGSLGYGREEWQGEQLSTHDLIIRLLLQNPVYPVEELITHQFPLEDYQEAIKANMDRGEYQSIKTVFRFDAP